ncbi:MAG: class I SAM-dependent methyltransferase [Myxococcales bacterium]|nr:class I SAM-dependent methyltransferase [Myxococcales bacterium]
MPDSTAPARLAARPDLDTPWAIGAAAYAAIVAQLREMNARVLVEFGSGSSTIALSRDLPALSITSIEHDPRFLEATRAALGANATLEHRPLAWQRHGDAPYLSYTPGPLPASIDAVIIDGPPFWTRRGREACLYQCFDALRVGGRVFLDDYERLGERRIVRHWLRGFSGALRLVEVIDEAKRVAVLEKTAEATLAPSALVQIDAKAQALVQPLTSRLRRAALRLRGIDP